MSRRPKIAAFLWTIAFALIATRTAEAHLHLCLDGQEARSSFHVSDATPSCHNNSKGPADHQDQDVDTGIGTLATKSSFDFPDFGPLPVVGVLLCLLAPERSNNDFGVATESPRPPHPYLFLPLFRGPPA